MEVKTAPQPGYKPRALDAKTIAEAFQLTAEDRADQPAIRTKGDDFTMTWGEYAQQVEKIAGGLAALGIGRGDTVAIMLTNRPEFHPVDSAAMHLGATPFSIYNTYTPDQIKFLVTDAATKVLVTEQAFLDTVLKAKEGADALEHVVVIDGDAPDGGMTLDDLIAGGDDGFDFEAAWKAVEPDDILTLIYTSGTTGRPEGRAAHPREPADGGQGLPRHHRLPRGGQRRLVAPDGAHRRARVLALHPDPARLHRSTCCPDPRQVVGYLPEVRPDLVLRRPAHLGEAQGRDRGRHRGGAGRAEEGRDQAGARGRPEAGRADPGGRGGPRGARAAVAEVRRARLLEGPRAGSGSTASSRSTSAPRRRRRR